MTTKKERREALGRMTKAELVKTVVALDARQTKLLNEIARLQGPVATLQPHAKSLRLTRYVAGTLPPEQDALPEACGLCDVTTKPPHCEVPGCTAHVAGTLPWEQS